MQGHCEQQRHKINYLNKRLRLAKKERDHLKEALKKASERFNLAENVQTKLQKLMTKDLWGELCELKLKKRKKFSDVIRRFALTLHFYSPKGKLNKSS